MRIREVEWPAGILEKVERKHGLSQEEVEAAVLGRTSYIRRTRYGRYHVYAQSEEGACIITVISYSAGVARIISARLMTGAEKRMYSRRGK